MKENNPLISVAMKIIMNAGNARTKASIALDEVAKRDFKNAKAQITLARADITNAHVCQTQIIQGEAAGESYESCFLFTHAQDTLMTVMSEVNLAEKLIMLFESFMNENGN